MSTVTVIPVEATPVAPPTPKSTWILAAYDASCEDRETAQDFSYVSLSSDEPPHLPKQYLLIFSFLSFLLKAQANKLPTSPASPSTATRPRTPPLTAAPSSIKVDVTRLKDVLKVHLESRPHSSSVMAFVHSLQPMTVLGLPMASLHPWKLVVRILVPIPKSLRRSRGALCLALLCSCRKRSRSRLGASGNIQCMETGF